MAEEPGRETKARPAAKSPSAFRTISEVAGDLDVPQHVLRFWESKFTQIRPLKRAGGRRYYRPDDVELLRRIRTLLYGDGYTIKGVRKLFRERGIRAVVGEGRADRSDRGRARAGDAAPGVERAARRTGKTDRAALEAVLDELVESREMLRAARR